MKQALIQGGQVVVQEVPAPQVGRKNILVRVEHSCVSVGTELASVRMSGLPLYRRALKQPEHVRRTLEMVRDQGIRRTADRVRGKLAVGSPTGYSAAGVALEVGAEAEAFRVGERVACAGAGIANHAEVIDVPVNLAVKVPDGLGTDLAATVSLGAIALQGVRRAAPTVGETVLVLGLGVLGQLAVQILAVSGCQVIGSDLDPCRIELALASGLQWGINPVEEDLVEQVHRLTDRFGADAVLVTAATSSHELISQAMRATRKKGRVVVVGDVGLHLNRADLYQKELDFLISCSYGPGRYDPRYELQGQDYPLAYVRWTENRNMAAYLRLLAQGKISLAHLPIKSYSIDEAGEAYESLKSDTNKPLLTLLSYPQRSDILCRKVVLHPDSGTNGHVRVALVGAGGFAQGMHLPNLVRLRRDYALRAVMSRTGSSARAVATQNGAVYATTDYQEVLDDADVDLVLIATPHHLHAEMALKALEAGKHVFVEKPLALCREQLTAIDAFYRQRSQAPVLMTGFNRRFAPAIRRILEVISGRTTPLMVNYRMNAGYVPLDHWVHTEEGGGRNLGEACHIYDLFNCLTGARMTSVHAAAIQSSSRQWARNDNFVATVTYEDGSVCTLTYTAMGHRAYSKEKMELYWDGKVIALDDYKSLVITGGRYKGWSSPTAEKGHFEELEVLARCLRQGGEWPIPLWQQVQATEIALQVERHLVPNAPSLVG